MKQNSFIGSKGRDKKKHPDAMQRNANSLPTFCQRFAKIPIVSYVFF